jgi:hypothetical protein
MAKFTEAKTKREAEQNIGTDFAKMVKVDGGYLAFQTMADYRIWKGQK